MRDLEMETGEVLYRMGAERAFWSKGLRLSPRDGALLCQVKADLVAGGLAARFIHSAQAELLGGVEPGGDDFFLILGARRVRLPEALVPVPPGGRLTPASRLGNSLIPFVIRPLPRPSGTGEARRRRSQVVRRGPAKP